MQQRLCDVVLIAEGQRFDAHRAILAVTSDYMSALMENARFGDSSGDIVLNEMSGDSVELTLKYIYEGSCRVHPDQLEAIVSTASRLQIKSLLDAAEAELVKLVEATNCIHIADMAELYSLASLQDAAEKTMRTTFAELVTSDSLLSLPKPRLLALLADDTTRAQESDVFEAATRWLAACSERAVHATEILSLVRFSLMPIDCIETKVRTSPWMQSKDAAFILADAFKEAYYGVDVPRRRHRGKLEATGWAASNEEAVRVLVKDDIVTLEGQTYAFIDGLIMRPNSGIFEIHMRLVSENNSGANDEAATCFGVVSEEFNPRNEDGDWEDVESGVENDFWFLRRFNCEVYEPGNGGISDESIHFPFGATVVMRVDMRSASGSLSFSVDGKQVGATAKGIKCPVRACALVYDETAEVELLGCYCISDPEFTSAGEKTRS